MERLSERLAWGTGEGDFHNKQGFWFFCVNFLCIPLRFRIFA